MFSPQSAKLAVGSSPMRSMGEEARASVTEGAPHAAASVQAAPPPSPGGATSPRVRVREGFPTASDQNLHAESPAFPALSGRNEISYPRALGPAVSSLQCRRRTEVDANDTVAPAGGWDSRPTWAVRETRRANTPPGHARSPTPRPEANAPLYLNIEAYAPRGSVHFPQTGGFHAHRTLPLAEDSDPKATSPGHAPRPSRARPSARPCSPP
jgi:hypothetical protein